MHNRTLRVALLSLTLLVALVAHGHLWPGGSPAVPRSLATGALSTREYDGIRYLVYVPTSVAPDRPVTVLVALRGIGDKVEDFAAGLAPTAEANGWLLVVPQFPYGNWRQVEVLRSDAARFLPWLDSLLGALPEESSLRLREQALLYGFSMGGQTVHRFALAYPDRVLAVATMSAGTYTLPTRSTTEGNRATALEFPMGVGDLDRVCGKSFDKESFTRIPFWVGVGARDNVAADIPRDFDRFLGASRVDRARAFAEALARTGARVELAIIPNLAHGESAESRSSAFLFLRAVESEPAARRAAAGS